MRQVLIVVLAALVGVTGMLGGASPAAASHDIVIGMQCDRTGPTQIVGTVLCPGSHDYFALVNSKGGVEGHKLKVARDRPRVQGAAGRRVLRAPQERGRRDACACTARRRSTRSPRS